MIKPETFVEIDLGAIARNVASLKNLTSNNTRLMAVVKADGYGHGAVEVARTALENGARELAVSRLPEARKIREAGIDVPMLIFSYVPPEHTSEMIQLNLRPSVNSLALAEAYSREAGKAGKKLIVHIKIDTGMGRLGMLSGVDAAQDHTLIETIMKLAALPWIEPEGIYTHFANADSPDKSHAKQQLATFTDILDRLKTNGVEFPVRHAANSAALIEMPESHLDMVRPGISIYGYYPARETDHALVDLKPAMTLKSTIIQIKTVPPGFKVSYGSTCQTEKPCQIATVPLGYADGYARLLSSKGTMLVHGTRCPVMGRVCMDLTMIDVSGIEDVRAGEEVVAFGRQNDAHLSVDEVADLTGTISYEVVCGISHRVPRFYVQP